MMTDLVMKYVAPDGKRPDLDKVVSNKFAGGVKLTVAEWSGLHHRSRTSPSF